MPAVDSLLYEIERQIRGRSPAGKKKLRKRSAKILCSLKRYLEQVIDQYTPKDAVRIAIQCILNHWEALSVYVEHEHGIIDNNPTYPKFIIIQTSDITDLFSVLNGK